MNVFALFSWSWRESNPRPNKETISFLHTYLRLNFRVQARAEPPTCTLSSKFSFCTRGCTRTILDLAALPIQTASRRRRLGNVLFQHLVPKLSLNLLWFD